jgi:hypothetical protein
MSETSLSKPTDTIDDETSPESLAAALGQVVGREREQYRRVRELVEARIDTMLANLRAAEVETFARIDAKVAERLAQLRDGKDGQDGKQGEAGPQGLAGE